MFSKASCIHIEKGYVGFHISPGVHVSSGSTRGRNIHVYSLEQCYIFRKGGPDDVRCSYMCLYGKEAIGRSRTGDPFYNYC